MKSYLVHDEWSIIEEGFHAEYSQISESIFSIGNGMMGQRANFEEGFSGHTLQGSYVAGIYYPDKTKVGWWKNGYPEYFAKVLNAPSWNGLDVEINGVVLDLATCEVEDFRRELNMKEGYLQRTFTARLADGSRIRVEATRFCSLADPEIGAIRYRVTPLEDAVEVSIEAYVDAGIVNQDSNYDEKFWIPKAAKAKRTLAWVLAETKKTGFQVGTAMKVQLEKNGEELEVKSAKKEREDYAGLRIKQKVKGGHTLTVYKYAAVLSSLNHEPEVLAEGCQEKVRAAAGAGFDRLLADHAAAWAKTWEGADIQIHGDVAAQQAIRFNIFQLYQTYTGQDARLNIGPKGFTGEKYGGSTYWDTEAYCLPFYLSSADQQVARNLLVYRYNHLDRAIENAGKLGFSGGAALYPMVTMNGEECHNEWEITFEEIHRNGAIAYAIYDYVKYTGDEQYLAEYGLEVLIAISRFWAQRVHWSEWRQKYVMHGVTGPNEYENNVNNNWYTNFIARWCLQYTLEVLAQVERNDPAASGGILQKTGLEGNAEQAHWEDIIQKMYLPEHEQLGIFLQQDGFLDKQLMNVDQLDAKDRPLNQNWSWDRILRSCFIKQADVLQGLYFFEDQFDLDAIRRNFDFYEPKTVHESSLSPCVHAILAARLGKEEKAYEMYLRTARLDLDDYNNDTEDGLHITSMAGTWMSVVKGFAGMKVVDGQLSFAPFIPSKWEGFSFVTRFRGRVLRVTIDGAGTTLHNLSAEPMTCRVNNQVVTVDGLSTLTVNR
ncbi:MAG: glycoside hydrolase family 65 protein [Saprospiraceae bacterium]|nr:glycoside hydrolase family 65 protein [Saprospiraceae bacterium]MDP4999982.1 glycoside hydrolase family 65 protein [Saprospiraceae bacterium]